MEDKSKLFSQAALDKLRSPEKLDMMLPITTPVGWMGLAAIALLLLSVVLWSIFGSFTVRAEGMGLIMDSGGLVNITHTSGGKVARIHVREGEQVKKGSLIAQMEQAEQSADVHMAQYGTQLGESMKDTAQRAYQYKNKMYQQEIARDIISDYDGVVDQVLVEPGSYVSGGTPLVTVRQTRKRSDLRGVLFIPVNKGKRLEPGQSVQLVPGGVDVQESGSLLGVVRKVSDYPVMIIGKACKIQQLLGLLTDLLFRHIVQPSLILHYLVHGHILAHGRGAQAHHGRQLCHRHRHHRAAASHREGLLPLEPVA